jgi:hypothetical protein
LLRRVFVNEGNRLTAFQKIESSNEGPCFLEDFAMTSRLTIGATFSAALAVFALAGCQEPAYGPGTENTPSLEEQLEQPEDATSGSVQTDRGDTAAGEEASAESDTESGLGLDVNVDVGEDGVDVEVGENGVDVSVGEEGVDVEVGGQDAEKNTPSSSPSDPGTP